MIEWPCVLSRCWEQRGALFGLALRDMADDTRVDETVEVKVPLNSPMPKIHSRRHLLLATSSVLLSACASSRAAPTQVASTQHPTPLADIEERIGGRLGVFALDAGSGSTMEHRADERFAMCSTFKWILAAAVLKRVDEGEFSLDERVSYGPGDLLEYAPVAREHASEGAMTIGALAGASVTVSDNTAANLLLAKIGGPLGLTRFIRSQGDTVTRLDRNEPTLNTNDPGDPRDTTSPRAMVGLMRRVLCESALSDPSREILLGWMRASETGKERLRAGFPPDWTVGDKTGSGRRNAVNNVAIAWPPGRAPILVAVYTSDSSAEMNALQAAHADVARLVGNG